MANVYDAKIEIPFLTTAFRISWPAQTRKRKIGIPVQRILNGTGIDVLIVITVQTAVNEHNPHFQLYFSLCCFVPYKYFIKYIPNSTSGTLRRKKNWISI